MRDEKGTVWIWWAVGGKESCELLESKGREDRYNVRVVREVKVKRLVKREVLGAAVQGDVIRCVGSRNEMVL